MIEILKYIGLSIVVFVALLVGFSILFRIQKIRRKYAEKYTILQVRVAKESESGPIVAEQIYATLHGIQSKFSFWQKLRGYSSDNVSFEIASANRSIKFYVAFPAKLRNLVEGQIYAQYPDVEIEDAPDYAENVKFKENAMGTELKFSDSDVFPIKRYPQFEDKLTRLAIDPIAGITASLLKFDDPADQAWIQVVATPLPDKWRIVFTKCVKILKKGIFGNIDFFKGAYARAFCTRKLWPKIVFFPIYFVFWIQGLLITAKLDLAKGGSGTSLSSSDEIEESTSKSHERESDMDAAMDKVVRPLFGVTIRLVHIPKNKDHKKAQIKLREIVGAYKQFSFPHLNSFEIGSFFYGSSIINAYRKRIIRDDLVLNNEELATIYHLPNLLVKTPTIYWVQSRKLEPPADLPTKEEEENITVLGRTNFRGSQSIFGVKPIDRRRHIYVIGKTGMGKSTLLENMIYSDIMAGRGVGVIDPHGDLADAVLNFIPSERTNDVVLVDPSDKEHAVAFNMLENVDPALGSIVCSGLVGIFKKIYADSWGPRLEHILRNTILALLEYPGTSMLGITRILSDDAYRKKIVREIEDPVVKSFWIDEFGKMQDRIRVEAISPIQNKVGQFLSSPVIRNIVGQPKSTIDLRFAMDKGKIVIINLSKGKIGEDNSALLGAMFITKFQLDAMSRASIPEKDRKDFYLYVDEFQNFATESFATILSEARKYKLNSFQVGFDDAEYISQQFGEEILPPDLVSLSKYTAYMRLLIEGMPTKTFSLVTLPPPELEIVEEQVERVRKVSRERYSRKVTEITDKIKRWSSREKKDEKDDRKK